MNPVELRKWSEALLETASRLSEQITHYAESIDNFSVEMWDRDRRNERRTKLLSGIDGLIGEVRGKVEERELEEESSSLHPVPVWVLGLDYENDTVFRASLQKDVHPEGEVGKDYVIIHLSKFLETCKRVNTMVGSGDYDQIPNPNPSLVVYREVWKAQNNLAKKDPVQERTLTLRTSNQKKKDSASNRSEPTTIIDPKTKRSYTLTLRDRDKKGNGD